MAYSILIVDDDSSLRKVYKIALEGAGYQISEASNGAVALELLETNQYDLMLLDILMPTLDGQLVLKRLQKMQGHAGMKVIVLSAYPSFREQVAEYKVGDFLVKPIQMQELLDTVNKVFNA
jgi:DNA-binding response OmpR family regulator